MCSSDLCHSAKPVTISTTQKTTVLTVEFNCLPYLSTFNAVQPIRPLASIILSGRDCCQIGQIAIQPTVLQPVPNQVFALPRKARIINAQLYSTMLLAVDEHSGLHGPGVLNLQLLRQVVQSYSAVHHRIH